MEEPRTPSPPPVSTLPPGLAEHPDDQVLRERGRGGMGVVYLAENRMMGRKEVLKVVHRDIEPSDLICLICAAGHLGSSWQGREQVVRPTRDAITRT